MLAVGLLDGPWLLRLAIAPDAQRDAELAQRLVVDVTEPARGALVAGKVSVEAPTCALVLELLFEDGWHADDPWTPLVILSIIDPTLTNPNFALLERLRAAGAGDGGPITELLDAFSVPDHSPPELYSAGLHLATLCADIRDMPLGDSTAPLWGRDRAVRRAVTRIPAGATWPLAPQVAGQQGIIANCRH
jgi:hypothetical protein